MRQQDDCKMSGFAKSINHSITFHHFYDRIFGKKTLRSWRFWFGTKRNATCFFACYFVVASLNLDLSRGQILNDAKSIKNSKASTFLRAQIVAKKKFALFSFQSKFWQEEPHAKIGISILPCVLDHVDVIFSEGLIRWTLNGILWDKVIGSYHHFFWRLVNCCYQLLIDSSRAIKGIKRCATLIKFIIFEISTCQSILVIGFKCTCLFQSLHFTNNNKKLHLYCNEIEMYRKHCKIGKNRWFVGLLTWPFFDKWVGRLLRMMRFLSCAKCNYRPRVGVWPCW